MDPQVIVLQELVQWAAVGVVVLLFLGVVLRALVVRRQAKQLRKRRRKCAQCGLLQETEPGEPKFGTCAMCGGVTSRGRSRKLG